MKIQKDKSFSRLTTFGVGGKPQYFVEVKNEKELKEAAEFSRKNKLPLFVIGEGSNLLVSDSDFKGLVIRLVNKKVNFEKKGEKVFVTAEAGLSWDNLVKLCVDKNLAGIECLSGIPGTVGAAPFQNIGAYGQELKNTFVDLKAYDLKKDQFVKLNKNQCQFGYRNSFFKKEKNKGQFIIFEIRLKLLENGQPAILYTSLIEYLKNQKIKNPDLKKVRQAVLDIRSQKLVKPSEFGNAGSFFKNPVVDEGSFKKIKSKFPDIPFNKTDGKFKLYAGWLIEKSDWKGKTYKTAGVSPNNALVIIALSSKSKASDILNLEKKIIEDVKKQFNIRLEPEVQHFNFQ